MHLFLSPHYDDAVYSCGGLISRLTTSHENTRVYTVMGAKPPEILPNTPFIRELHARWQAGEDPVKVRRQEDETAVYLLDAQVGYNNAIPDCVYRTAYGGRVLYPDVEAIFAAVDPDDPATVALELKLPTAHQLWQDIQFDEAGSPLFVPIDPSKVTIYAPLGVGNHVDHQIVRDWAFKLHQTYPTLTLMLYEDFPYNRESKSIAPVLKTLPFKLTQTAYPLDAAFIEARIKAMMAYRTQFNTFWTDEQALIDDVWDTMTERGQGSPSEVMYRVER
jgi:LmbE family N-acetylglucosaminyl deacetylase